MVTNIAESEFDTIVEKHKNVLVDCWAPWCGPCKRIGPILEEISLEYGDEVKIVKIDVDEAPGISARFNISAIPSLLFFKDGVLLKKEVGLKPKNEILRLLEEYRLIAKAKPIEQTPIDENEIVKTLSDSNIDSFIANGKSIVDCWAPWCGPCRRMGPIIDELGKIGKGSINVGKLNVDDNSFTSGKYGISSIPTLLIFNNGVLVDKLVGLDPAFTPEYLLKYVLDA